jgi:hypothetical protein
MGCSPSSGVIEKEFVSSVSTTQQDLPKDCITVFIPCGKDVRAPVDDQRLSFLASDSDTGLVEE